MWTPFDPAVVRRVFTTESRQKDEALFNLTHSQMNRILVSHNRVGLNNGQFIGEHEVLDLIEQSAPLDHNRVWFIVGETGSGKSELCQWLEYRLHDRHVPIHISRRQANLTGILDVLGAHLPPGALHIRSTLPQAVLTDHLRLHLRLRAHREGAFTGYIEDLEPYLPEIAHRLYGLAPNTPSPTADLPPPPADLPLMQWLTGAAREVMGVQSLEPVLRALAQTYAAQGRRPVLLLEDITTLGFLRDDLLDYIFDLAAPGFDAVIGLTSGFEQTHLAAGADLSEMAYVRDRLSARFQLSHENGETFFLSRPGDLHDLVRRYLGCLPSAAAPQANAFDGLYPFTPVMLDRLYLQLVESGNARQTPRNLLDAVIKPALSLREPPHLTLFRPHPYLRAPSLTFYHADLPPDITALLYWYGELHSTHLTVPDEVASAFGLPPVPPVQAFVTPTGSTTLYPSTVKDDPEEAWRDTLREAQLWHGTGTAFPKRQALKRGIERMLSTLTSVRDVQHPHLASLSADPLEFSRGSQLPIYLPESGDLLPTNWPSLQFPRTLSAQFFEECLTYSFSSSGHVECFADLGHTREILERVGGTFQEEVRAHLRELLGLPYETLVFGMWWLCQHACQGAAFSARDPDGKQALLQYDLPARELRTAWRAERPHRTLHRTHQELRENRSAYRALFISVFHHRDDLLDTTMFERECARFDPTLFLRTMTSLPYPALQRAPFRQRGSKRPLAALLKPVMDYAGALQNYEPVQEDGKQWSELQEALAQALDCTDELDAVCRDLERLSHQAGWTVPVPTTSHQWRSLKWREDLTSSQTAFAALGEHPPLTHITVQRSWLEYLDELPPLVWMKDLKRFYGTLVKVLRERHPGFRKTVRFVRTQNTAFIDLEDLEALKVLVQEVVTDGQHLPDDITQQVTRAVTCWEAHHPLAISEVLQRHALEGAHAIAQQSKEGGVRLMGDLLECTADLLQGARTP